MINAENRDSHERIFENRLSENGTKSKVYYKEIASFGDGISYERSFKDDRIIGKEKYTWENGDASVSESINDKNEGPFTRYESNESIVVGCIL